MRITPPAIALAVVLATVSSAGQGQKPDTDIDARSVALVAQGKASLAAGDENGAIDSFETALAVDPKNRAAFIALGQVSQKQGLPGKAIRYYREALTIEPNDVTALSEQGEAMVQKGAVAKAEENLAKIKSLCVSSCTEQTKLAAAIQRGAPAAAVLSAQAVKPSPTIASDSPEN